MTVDLERVLALSKISSVKREQLLSYLFELTETESSAYFTLLNESALGVQELADHIERDRTTAQRVLRNLVEKDLVQRVKENLKKGGVKYNYEAVAFSFIKGKMVERLDVLHSATKDKVLEL